MDKKLDTRWSCLNEPGLEECELILGLDEPRELDSVSIAFYRGDQRYAHFDLYGSRDEACFASPKTADWMPVYTGGMSGGNTTAPQSFPFTKAILNCIRYVGRGNSENEWNSILEFDVSNDIDNEEKRYAVTEVLGDDFRQLAQSILPLQRQSDGFWNPSIFDTVAKSPTASEGTEASGTALITYVLAKGVNIGVLERDRYLPAILKAWNGLQAKALIFADSMGLY